MIYFLSICLALGFVITVLVFFRKDNTISIEEAKRINETVNSHYFNFSNQQFHYVEKGTGELIVLIHGIGDSFYVFNDLSDLLAKSYKVVSIDLPAFGLSEVPQISKEHQNIIGFYRSFMDAFIAHKNVVTFHLIGNSLGGLIAWDWAINNTKFNLKSLTLIASAGFETERVKKNVSKGILDKLPQFLLRKGAPLFISKISADVCIADKSKINKQFILAHHTMLNKKGTVIFFINLLYSSFEPRVEKLADLTVPTLIVWGTKDKIIPISHAYKFEKSIKNSQVKIYKNVGHYPQVEKYEELAVDYLYFIKNI